MKRKIVKILIVCAFVIAACCSCRGGECEHKNVAESLPQPPTCTETGVGAGKYCADCGKIIEEGESVPALGHTPAYDLTVQPTCTEDGATGDSRCTVCGEILKKSEVIPAKGHSAVVDPGRKATCTENGITDGAHCRDCGELLQEQRTDPIKAHEYVDGVCKNCGGVYRISEGLEYKLNADSAGYTVIGAGSCKDTEIVIPSDRNGKPVTAIGVRAFRYCSAVRVTLPDSITRIEGGAFAGCTKLAVINIPAGVTYIGAGAFEDCGALAAVNISNGIVEIGNGAFSGCSGLESISIPDSVTSIGERAFCFCV